MGVRDDGRKVLDCMRVMRGASAGRVSVPAGGEYLVISKDVHQIDEMEQGSFRGKNLRPPCRPKSHNSSISALELRKVVSHFFAV